MEERETKPLKVTENQQKLFDVLSVYWPQIIGFLVTVLTVAFSAGYFIKGITYNIALNDIRIEYDKKIDSVKRESGESCEKLIAHYQALVNSITPASKNGKEDKK